MPQAVAVWVANAIVAVGSAATAATGVAAFTTAAVSIGTGTIALSGALGIGAAVSAWSTVASVVSLASRPKIPQASGGQVSLKLDPQAPIPVALGRTATGGYIIYRAGLGPKNKHLAIISALSTGPIQAIEDFYANDIQCTFTSTSAGPTTTSGQWTNKMRQFRLLGATSDAAYDLAVPPFEAELPGWTSAHKTTGFATSLWVNEFDSGRYPTGLPRGLWVVQGEKFYDPRLDSTYPGGSGSHRLATPSTWAYTENPYIMALGWILGRFHNSKKVWGCGVAASGIDWVSYVDGANVADANAWKAGGVVTTADDKWSVLTAILQAGGGVPVARGGQVSCLVSTPKTSVYSITSADVIGEVSIQTSMPRRNRINKVVPKYRSEANRWQIVAADAVTNSTYLTEDASEVRSKEVEYSLVQQVNQAAQLAAYDLANAREGLTMTVTCKPRLLNVRVGEALTITLDELGLSGQKCIVLGRSFDPASLQVSLTLRSETDAKHAYALGKTGIAPPSPSLTAYDPSTIAAPAAGTWTATGGTINNGTIAQPAILVTGAADDVNAQSVIVEYRPAASATYRLWAEGPASSTNFEITGVAASSSYVVAVSYRSIRGVVGSRIELAAVTTGTLTSGTVAGQGALATLGFVALGTNVRRADGTTVLTDAAAVTSLGTAAAITGQGNLATANRDSLAFGANGAINSDFSRALYGWAQGGASSDGLWTSTNKGLNLASWNGFRNVAWLETPTGTTPWLAGGTAFVEAFYSRGFWSGEGSVVQTAFGVPVKNGDRIFARCLAARHRCDLKVYALIFDKTGALLEAPEWTGGRINGGANGDPANFDEVGGLHTINNVNASSMSFLVRMFANGGVIPYVFITEPAFGIVPAGQTVLPPYQPGRSDPFGDQTGSNTAAAITGQGAFATLSQAAWATQVTGLGKPEDYATKSIVYRQTTAPASPTLNDIWVLLDGSSVPQSVRAWNGSAWVTSADITSLNTASAIAGQGSLATANSVNFRSSSVYGRPQNLNNIVNKPSFGDGALGGWDAGTIVSVTGQAFTKALQLTPLSATVGSVEADPAAPGSRGTRVTPGDKFFFDFWVDTSTVTAGQSIIVGLDGGNDAGSYINSAPQISSPAGVGWQRVTGSGVIPASVVWVRPFVYVTGGTGAARFAEITISKAQPGADITSTNTAAAVTGQGAWATTDTPLASLLSPSANLLYNPTANLGLQNWTIDAGTFAVSAFGGEGQYFSNSTGATSPGVRMYSDVLVYANSAYSLSCEVFAGGLTVVSGGYAQARCYIQWLTAGGVHISYSATIAHNAGGNWTYFTNPNQIAPATAATARITIDIWGGGSWTNTNSAWRKVKFENNSVCTPFSDERTTGALYLNNATIDSLKPGEINANVTETRTASSIAGQGSLATLGHVALGSNVRRADGTTILTDAAAVTSLGTAAAIAGQAAWATYSGSVESVTQPGANLVFDGGLKLGAQGWTLTRTAYGYDPNLGALFITGLNNSMAQSPIFPVSAGAQYVYSANIGGTFSAGNLYAFIYWVNAAGTIFTNSTGVYPTSGAGFGRLSLAVIAPAGAVNGIFVVATGAGSVTQAVAYKMKVEQSNGSAASVFSDEATNGALYRSGVNIDSLKPGEINANVTETRTAAAITGQGNLATANRSSLAFGANGAINSDFARSLFGWVQHTGSADGLYTAARGLDLASWFGLRHVAWMNVQSGATAWPVGATRYADVLYSRGFWTGEGESIQNAFGVPVKAGDRIFARALVGRHRCDVQVYALVFDKTGTLVEAPSWGGGRDGGGSNGNPANFDEVGGLYTITNANAASMSILVRMLGNGGADPYAFITEPAFGVVPSGQTVLPAYQPGRSDPYADQTSSNTASAITGQGTLATANLATTALIAANAVTKSATARTAGTISLPASTWTTVQTASITTSGGDVRVDVSISADLLNLSGTSKSLSLRILRDGTSIYSGTLGTAFGSSSATVYSSGIATTDYVEIPGQFSGSNTLFIIDAAPSSTAHTYTVDVNPEGSATAYERNVFLLEIKR